MSQQPVVGSARPAGDPEVVDLLMRLLEHARAGQVVGVAVVASMRLEAVVIKSAGKNPRELAYGCARLGRKLAEAAGAVVKVD